MQLPCRRAGVKTRAAVSSICCRRDDTSCTALATFSFSAGASPAMPESWSHAVKPATYITVSATAHTTSAARARGKRIRTSRPTNGSRICAMTTATIEVMKTMRAK